MTLFDSRLLMRRGIFEPKTWRALMLMPGEFPTEAASLSAFDNQVARGETQRARGV